MKPLENKLITIVIDQSKMTKEQKAKMLFALVEDMFINRAIQYMGRGDCTNNWIAINDRLPPPNTEVLFFNGLSMIFGTYAVHETPDEYSHWVDKDNDFWCEMDEVTHWLEIPQPPKA